MTTQPDQDPTLQEKLRADAASGECAKSTNLMLIAAADRLDELERQLAEAAGRAVLAENGAELVQPADRLQYIGRPLSSRWAVVVGPCFWRRMLRALPW